MELKKGYKLTEIGVFPIDWNILTIKEVANVISGGTPSTINSSFWDGRILWCTPTDITSNNKKYISETKRKITDLGVLSSSATILPIGAILFCSRATIGAMSITEKEITTNQGFKSLVVKSNCNNEYLYYRLHLDINKFIEKSIGSTFLEISKKDTLEIIIPLPPLKEQQAIAQVLTDTDQLIQNLKTLIAKKKAIKQGAMQELLTGKRRLKGFSGEWEEKTLGEIARFRRGSFPQPYGLPEWYDETNGTPFIQVYDVDKNMKLKPKTKQKISDLAKERSVFVEKGNIILTIQGSIGRIAITQYDAYVDRTLLIFTEYRKPINKVFFAYVVQEKFRIEKENAPGGTIKTITKEELSKFEIKLPKNKEEQNTIAQILSDMDAEIEALEIQLQKTQNLKQGMMQELLTGKIRLVKPNSQSHDEKNESFSMAAESNINYKTESKTII